MNIKESKIYTILFSFVVTFVFVFILALANNLTRDKVNANKELFKIRAVLKAFDIPFENDEQAFKLFNNNIKTLTNKENGVYFMYKDKVAIIFSGDALWSTVTSVAGIDYKNKRLTGLAIIDQNETPGLGGRITEDWFLNQFKGETFVSKDNMIGIKFLPGRTDRKGDNDKNNAEIDGISGASLTSKGLEKALNKSLPILIKLANGDTNG